MCMCAQYAISVDESTSNYPHVYATRYSDAVRCVHMYNVHVCKIHVQDT